jgi:hypothetical protein
MISPEYNWTPAFALTEKPRTSIVTANVRQKPLSGSSFDAIDAVHGSGLSLDRKIDVEPGLATLP